MERRLVKDRVIEALWPETSPEAGANSLYQTLHNLRQTLDTSLGTGCAESVLCFQGGILSLEDGVWLDTEEFERRCAGSSPDDWNRALALYHGDLLPDNLYDEWTQARREALQRLQRETAFKLAEYEREAGDYPTAIRVITPLLSRDPTDEAAHRELMRLYALSGQRHEALRQYQRCVDVLDVELDLPPDAATDALHTQILNGTLSASDPRLQNIPRGPPSWSLQSGVPLVGREAELVLLRQRIFNSAKSGGKTILLIGDAGVGKTRLAHEVLRDAAERGLTTLSGAAYEQEGQLIYQPFVEAFDRYLATASVVRTQSDHPLHAARRQRPPAGAVRAVSSDGDLPDPSRTTGAVGSAGGRSTRGG